MQQRERTWWLRASVAGWVLLCGCGSESDLAPTQPLPYREVAFDSQGVARFTAARDDVLLVYRTGALTMWREDGAPPYEPIALAPVGQAPRVAQPAPVPLERLAAPAESWPPPGRRALVPGGKRLYRPEAGDTHTFYNPDGTSAVFELMAIGEHCYVWATVTEPATMSAAQAQVVVTEFDRIYPLDLALFGAPSDLDHDPRIHLGFAPPGSIGPLGEFSSAAAIANGVDCLLFSAGAIDTPANPALGSLLAHELQHNICWAAKGDGGGLSTVYEGLSRFAELIATPTDRTYNYPNFLRYPPGGSLRNNVTSQYSYGAGFSLCTFVNDRFGPAALKQLSGGSPLKGGENLQQATGLTPERLLVEWATALLLTGRTADPRYRITSVPVRGDWNGVALPTLGMFPLDGSATGQCRSWGFCYCRATVAGGYTATVAPGHDFRAVLVPGGAVGL